MIHSKILVVVLVVQCTSLDCRPLARGNLHLRTLRPALVLAGHPGHPVHLMLPSPDFVLPCELALKQLTPASSLQSASRRTMKKRVL